MPTAGGGFFVSGKLSIHRNVTEFFILGIKVAFGIAVLSPIISVFGEICFLQPLIYTLGGMQAESLRIFLAAEGLG